MLWKIILSGLFLVCSFPNFNLSFLAYIGFIPIFFAIENKSPVKAFLIFYISGFIFYLGALYWLCNVTAAGLVIACLYLAIYFGIFGLVLNYFGILSAPIAWVILEYIQSIIPIMGFGWISLGYSQYRNLPLIQIADFSGVYGVSFIIMMINAAIYRVFKRSFVEIIVSALILIAVFGYGMIRSKVEEFKNDAKISVVQGNIPQEIKWDPVAQDMIIEKHVALTKMAALDSPDLIVWPETAFPRFFEAGESMTDKVLALAKEIKIPILIGTNTEIDGQYFNSAVFISSEGDISDRYDKIHLVPFGEYVPFSDKFPVLHKLILGELGEFTPGKDFKIFKLKSLYSKSKADFGVLICFEDIFPEISKKFIKNGAKFLIVITNDAWYGKSGAAYQHAANSVFRAIENRIPVIRCANTGYSCFIDSRGRIYDSVSEKNKNLFITGYKTAVINIK